MCIDFIDVRRAYFHAEAMRDVFVKLPNEDYEEGKCGKLLKAMYGTRDAGMIWEDCDAQALLDLGFRKGIASPCPAAVTIGIFSISESLITSLYLDVYLIPAPTIITDFLDP